MKCIPLYGQMRLITGGGRPGFHQHGMVFSLTGVLSNTLNGIDAGRITKMMEAAKVTPYMMSEAWDPDAEWYHIRQRIRDCGDEVQKILVSCGTSRAVAEFAARKFPIEYDELQKFWNLNRKKIKSEIRQKIRECGTIREAAHMIGNTIPEMLRERYVKEAILPSLRDHAGAA